MDGKRGRGNKYLKIKQNFRFFILLSRFGLGYKGDGSDKDEASLTVGTS